MVSNQHRRAIGVFRSRSDAEQAVYDLRNAGFPIDRVSVINQQRGGEIGDVPVRDSTGNQADEGATIGAVSGGIFGGLTGLFVGLGALALPGIGPVMLAGALATTLATAISGTAIGAVTGGLLGALIGLGIPEEQARVYSERVAKGDYLVIVDGTDPEIARAETILRHRGVEDFGLYHTPSTATLPERQVLTTTGNLVVTGSNLAQHQYAVGLFSRRSDAERAIAQLRSSGFPLHQVSLVAKDFEPIAPFAGVELRHRFEPMRMGFPEDQARYYYDRIDRGDYVLIVNGTSRELSQAEEILRHQAIEDFRLYDASAIAADRTGYSYIAPEAVAEIHDPTPTQATEAVVISTHPEVVIIDHRNETL